MKRSIEFKVFTHLSKFTNDLVEKDFLFNSTTRNIDKKLPKLPSKTGRISHGSETIYDKRGKYFKIILLNY